MRILIIKSCGHFESLFSRKGIVFGWVVSAITLPELAFEQAWYYWSVIRESLRFFRACYGSMIIFFAHPLVGWKIYVCRWFRAVKEYPPLYQEGGSMSCGDWGKASKERASECPSGKQDIVQIRNPRTLLNQSISQNGHMFGGTWYLGWQGTSWACNLLKHRLNDDRPSCQGVEGRGLFRAPPCIQMVEESIRLARTFAGFPMLYCLDRVRF